MTWTRHSDDYADRLEIAGLTDAAYRAHDAALIWCNRQLTSGYLPDIAVRVVLAYVQGDHDSTLTELDKVGLWTRTEGGWQVDWTDQEESDAVAERRDRNAKRQAEFRERSSRHRDGDHSLCNPQYCKALIEASDTARQGRNASRNALRNGGRTKARNASRNGAPTLPNPSPPNPTQPHPSIDMDGWGRGGTSAGGRMAPEGATATSENSDDARDWSFDEWTPWEYMLSDDPGEQHYGGWTPGHTSWARPSIWRDGYGPNGKRPEPESGAA